MELLASRPLIRAMVNGQGPFAFLLQPESAATQIDRKLAEALKLARQPGISDTPTFAIDLGFESSTTAGVSVEITDMSSVVPEFGAAARPRGVISLSAWKERLVTIDYSRWHVVVEPGALPEPNGRDVFLLSASRELLVPLAIGERSISCRVDPFFPRGLVLPASFVSQLQLAGKLRDVGPITTKGGTVAASEASLMRDAVLASFVFKNPLVLFAGSSDVAIVGGQWLAGFSITYDVAHSRARLDRR